jgi:class 3 adenylate cyclase
VVYERRLVSVLFADPVGFTALSEHRDPEDVSDLLEPSRSAADATTDRTVRITETTSVVG